MLRLLMFVLGVGLMVTQAAAGPMAAAPTGMSGLTGVLLDALTPDNNVIRVQTGGSDSGKVGDRSKHRVVIFTDDKARVKPLLAAIKRKGYHKDSYITDEPNRKWNIKWGSASAKTVDEILGLVKSELGLKLSKVERLHQFKPDDTDIFINLRFSAKSAGRRSKHRVVIFTDDKSRVEPLLAAVKQLGYDKKSYIADKPNQNWNIKWGAATDQTVNEILALVKKELGIESSRIKRLHKFEADDNDIFVNLRFGKSGKVAAPSGRGKHRVVIFTNDNDQVQGLLSAIKEMGYSSDSHLAEKPNDDWNIKWGAASADTIDELLQVIDKEMGIPPKRLRKSHEFESNDNDIFINLKF